MRISKSILFLCLSLFLSTALEAEILTWEQCVSEATRGNAAVKSAYEAWKATSSRVQVSKSQFLPLVSADFSARYGRNESVPFAKAGESYNASLNISQNIFNGWADTARVEQSQADVAIADSSLQIAKAQAAFDLKSAYADLVYAQRAIRLQENIRDRRKSNLNLVDLRFDNGSENKGSVLLSQAYLSQAELNIIQASNKINIAAAQLARALGRDGDQPLRVAETVPAIVIPKNPDFQALALTTPQRVQAVYREKSAESSITLSKAGYFPTLGITGSLGRQDDSFFPQDRSWSLGLLVSIPIFNGGRDYYSTQAAIATRSAAGATREDLDRQLLSTLNTNLSRLTEAKKNLEVTQSFLKASEMRAEIGRSRYNNGLLSFDDWDVIETDLINRQQANIQSERDYILAEATWENGLGTGSIK